LKRLLLAGGGHAHVEVLRDLGERRGDFEATLVTPYPWLTYSGMVPGLIAGHYGVAECTIDLARLASRAGVRASFTSAISVDAQARVVRGANGEQFSYDVLSLDVGCVPHIDRVAGVAQHAVVVRPLEAALKEWARVLDRARDGDVDAVTLVGAGAAGVELALAMEYRFRRELGAQAPHVRILGDAPHLVPEFPAGARMRLSRRLERRGIGVHLGSRVTDVSARSVHTEHGIEFASDAVFWTAGAAAPAWIRETGLATDERGFVAIDDFMRSESHPEVFAVGDCSARRRRPFPKAGVFAVTAAPVLASNLRAALAGERLTAFKRARRYLALVSTGERHAVAAWNGFSSSGAWVWRMKDRIDRAFVARYAS